MQFPKDDKNYKWTSHIKNKMVFYRISPQIIKNILNTPDRREIGIAPNTMAVMKRRDTPKRKEEMWVMYARPNQKSKIKIKKLLNSKIILISTWRYPGVTKKGKNIPIPEDVLQDIQEWMK
ncbi:MAG: hypothetical protein Q8Q37_02335 [bacterium]|nr:hypothetical protein [bacterium]